jgi:hypothetical protein
VTAEHLLSGIPGWVLVVGGAVGLWLVWRVILVVITRLERVNVLGAHEPLPPGVEVHPFLRAVSTELEKAGFLSSSAFYSVSRAGTPTALQAGVWCSADGQTLALGEAGRLYGLDGRRLTLRTKLQDGTVVESADQMQRPDLTGILDVDFLLNASVSELLQFHHGRVQQRSAVLGSFDPSRLLDLHEALELERARRLEEAGLATLDSGQCAFRFTWAGALALTRAYKKQKARMWAQGDRINRPRPGE